MIGWLLLLATGAIAAAALAVRYMRTPRVREVTISALAFLPAFSSASRDRVQWRLAAPILSWRFWLRLATIALLVASSLAWTVRFDRDVAAHLGIRIVVDTSPSMRLGTPTRLAQARQFETELRVLAAANQGCVDIATLPSDAEPRGLSLSDLLAAAGTRNPDAGCTITHTAVITDLPRPPNLVLADLGGEGAIPLWFQVGRPQANAALSATVFRPPTLRGGAGSLSIQIDEYGDADRSGRRLVLTGPDGAAISPVESFDLTQAGTQTPIYPITAPGRYVAELTDPGGLPLDDHLVIDIPSLDALVVGLSPQLADPALRAVVSRLGEVDEAAPTGAMVIAPYAGPQSVVAGGIYLVPTGVAGSRTLGYFDQDSPVLTMVDLDLLEQMGAMPVAPLPDGFRVAAKGGSTGDGAWVAVRGGDDPAVIMPGPPPASGPGAGDTGRSWWVMFINAFDFVTEGRLASAETMHADAAGQPLAGVRYESNTAQALGESDIVASIRPVESRVEEEAPWWPWVVLAAIALMLAERLVGQRREWT